MRPLRAVLPILSLAWPLGGCLILRLSDPVVVTDPYAVLPVPPYAQPRAACPPVPAVALAGAVQGAAGGALIGSLWGDAGRAAAIGAGIGAVAGAVAASEGCP